MRKSGLTGDEAYVLSKHGKTTEDLGPLKKEIGLMKEDLSNKITKFYASNQGEAHLADSDNGKIMDMMVYGKSSQDGTPSLENPVEIKSVVEPEIKITGKNLLPFLYKNGSKTENGVTFDVQMMGQFIFMELQVLLLILTLAQISNGEATVFLIRMKNTN